MRIGLLWFPVFFLINIALIGCSDAGTSQSAVPDVKSSSHERTLNVKSSFQDNTPVVQSVPTSQQDLFINSMPEKYSYENLLADIKKLQKENAEILQCVNLCDTADGRGVYDIILGNPNNDKQILILGAMHAREYITTQIVMRQLCDAVDVLNGVSNEGNYRDKSKKYLLENVTVHFIPMNNPDGVSISQFGLAGLKNTALQQQVSAMAYGDYEQWKANAMGVDLNRNFDAGWHEFIGAGYPSAERYKGAYPGSEPEAAANRINKEVSYSPSYQLSYLRSLDLLVLQARGSCVS